MFKNIIIIGLIISIFAGCHKDQSPQESVSKFRNAQEEVQGAVDTAKPHVVAFFDDVLKPAIANVKNDAAMVQAKSKQEPQPAEVAQVAVAGGLVRVAAPSWARNSTAKFCYSTGYRDNVECYSSPPLERQIRSGSH